MNAFPQLVMIFESNVCFFPSFHPNVCVSPVAAEEKMKKVPQFVWLCTTYERESHITTRCEEKRICIHE